MKIITFDGYRGSGKTTQIGLLKKKLGRGVVFLEWYYWWLSSRCKPNEIADHIVGFHGNDLKYIGYKPFISFWLDMPHVIATERASVRDKVPFEIRSTELYYDVRVAESIPNLKEILPNFYVLDGLKSVDILHEEIMSIVEKYFSLDVI